VSGTPTGTPSTTGGTLMAGNYFAKIIAVDQYGSNTAVSTESASVAVTGTTGSIGWAWTAVTGAVSYRIYVGPVTGGQLTYFTSTTNSFTQTAAVGIRDSLGTSVNNNMFYGEVSLPITTAIATAATAEIDYVMNLALPPAYRIIMGLGTTVAAGWQVMAIGGAY
jgi:1-deoxy-D-xylulose 5-phosphate reductoisomerase